MKLLCINAKEITTATHTLSGEGLKEGEIYTTLGKTFLGKSGLPCYYIEGLGARLVSRFTELLEDTDSQSEMAVKELKKEFNLS